MALLTEFTTADAIRAVLGVSDEEIEDATLALPQYAQLFSIELENIAATAESQYLTIKNLTPPVTALEQKYLDVVQLFAAYSTAKTLLGSLALFAPKAITDGRASMDRFPDPMDDVKEGVESMYNSLKQRLKDILGEVGVATAPSQTRNWFGVSPIGYNPITNI